VALTIKEREARSFYYYANFYRNVSFFPCAFNLQAKTFEVSLKSTGQEALLNVMKNWEKGGFF